MSYGFGRDRTEELRGSFEGRQSSDDFGPARLPTGYRRTPSPAIARAQSPPPPTPRHYGNEQEQYELQPRAQPVNADLHTMDGFLNEIEDLKRCIGILSDNVETMGRLHKSALGSYSDSQTKQTAGDIDRLQGQIHTQNADIKARITALMTNARAANASEAEIRKAQSETVRKRFLDTIRRYQEIENEYRQEFRERVGRQIRIVKPNATNEEIDRIIESDQNNQIFAQSILQTSRQAQSRAVLNEVQNRYDDIKRIERTLLELHQLFQDMEMLITQQGEVLIQIDEHADTAAKQLKEGNKMVDRAIVLARSTRGKKWWCLGLTIILCVVIAILVWWFGFGHPGVDTN